MEDYYQFILSFSMNYGIKFLEKSKLIISPFETVNCYFGFHCFKHRGFSGNNLVNLLA